MITREALDIEFNRLDRLAEEEYQAWRSADVLRDQQGGTLALRRSGDFLAIEAPPEGVRFGAPTLRVIARVLLLAAADIEKEGPSISQVTG